MKVTQTGILKTGLYVVGGLAAVGFLLTKNSSTLAWATSGSYRYGDLYRFAPVWSFKPAKPLPVGPDNNTDSIDRGMALHDDDKMIWLGDSFSFCDFGESPFETQVARKVGLQSFSVYNN